MDNGTANANLDISVDIMERIDRMAEISESASHLTRRCYTAEHRQAIDLTAGWMRDAGMVVREDAVGNLIGRYEGLVPDAPAILLGSHIDSVVMAGRYDGPLGILSAIDCVKSLKLRGIRFDNAVEVACFADEEGVRFQSTFLGSRGLAGTFETSLLSRKDEDGISLAEAMKSFGLDPGRAGDAARRPEDVRCYLEVHIEQGPVLENEGLAVCAVTAIAGANRMTVTVKGTAGHAGTVPMDARADALAAASECVLLIESTANRHPLTVATVGQISAAPGATNVIPGEVSFSVDVRAADDKIRRAALKEIKFRLKNIARLRGVEIEMVQTHDADGVVCAPWIVSQIESAMVDLGHRPFRLPSGAGHDAAALAEITDVGMIFVRCEGGVSHHPDEKITREDAVAATKLLLKTVERIGGASN